MMKFAILGGGHGGVAMSAHLTLEGHQVNLFQVPEFEKQFARIKETQTVELSGVAGEGSVRLRCATTDIAEAMEDVEHVLIVVPAFAQARMADLCGPYIKSGQFVYVIPGGFGSLIVYRKLQKSGAGKDIVVAETSTLPYGARMTGENSVIVHIRTVNLPMGALPAGKTEEAASLLQQIFPEVSPCKNILDAALSNTNPVIHVAPSILNTGRIEYADDFFLYKEGMTPSVRKVMVAADRERVAVRKACELAEPHYQLDPDSNDVFRDQFGSGALEAGKKMRGPLAMTERFITEDVPYGLVFYSSLGSLAGVETPTCDALIYLASTFNETDYKKEGRTLEELELDGWELGQLLRFLEKGE